MHRLTDWFELGKAEANRLLPMEGLRGLAVILVFFVHYSTLVDPYLLGMARPVAAALHVVGNAGVDLFFVLSGYLIYGILIRRPRPFLAFMGRRVQRLYPAFLAVFAVYLLLSAVLPSESKLPGGAWNNLLYVVENLLLLPGLFPIPSIIAVAWSLSYEMFFYLTVPLLIGLLRLRSWDRRARIATFLGAVIVAQALQLPHPRIGMFACGMVLAEVLAILRDRHADRPVSNPAALRLAALDLLALAAIPACGFVLLRDLPASMDFAALFVACFLLCLAGFAHRGLVATMLMARPLRWLGNMSYSYYLVHGLTLKIAFFALGHLPAVHRLGEAAFWVLLPPTFALTLIGSAVLFLLIERPFSILPAERVRKAPVLERAATLSTP